MISWAMHEPLHLQKNHFGGYKNFDKNIESLQKRFNYNHDLKIQIT